MDFERLQVLDMIHADMANLQVSLPESERPNAARYRNMITRFRARRWEQDLVDENGRTIWRLNDEAKEHKLELGKPAKSFDQAEHDIGQLHKTIAELTKEVKEMKEILKSNEKMAVSTRKVTLTSLEIAASATSKSNAEQKRLLEEHEVYTPKTKRVKLEEKAVENEEALSNFDAMDCEGLF